VAVDNTVATPVLTRPLELGADLVVHSATKYLNGHSDVLAGAVLNARRDPFWERIRSWRRNAGATLGPFEAWLLQRGMRTLFLRVHRASDSALAIATHLHGHPAVKAVLYPGLPSHPGHQVAARQMHGGFGGMLSIRLAGARSMPSRCCPPSGCSSGPPRSVARKVSSSTGAAWRDPPPRYPATCCACRSASPLRAKTQAAGPARAAALAARTTSRRDRPRTRARGPFTRGLAAGRYESERT
jgi:hypothetical protein